MCYEVTHEKKHAESKNQTGLWSRKKRARFAQGRRKGNFRAK